MTDTPNWLSRCAVRIAAFGLMLATAPAAAVDIASLPMVLPTPAQPNVVLTLKTPMLSYFTTPPYTTFSMHDLFWFYRDVMVSYHNNPISYNPNITYREPPGYEGKTSFEKALRYGYAVKSAEVFVGCEASFASSPCLNLHLASPSLIVDLSKPFCHSERIIGLASNYISDILHPHACDIKGAYYVELDTSKSHCTPGSAGIDCYKKIYLKDKSAEQKKNFAIWYSFYRNRELATRTSLLVTMPKLEGKIRLAWQGDHADDVPDTGCTVHPSPTCEGDAEINSLRSFSGAHKNNFYDWIKKGLPYEGYTNYALIRAAQYLGLVKNYRDDPTNDGSPLRSCRDNIHLVVGDVYTGSPSKHLPIDALPNSGEIDSSSFAAGASAGGGRKWAIDYTPRPPYMDRPLPGSPVPDKKYQHEYACTSGCENRYSLADLAMYYWATDLAPEVEDTLVPSIMDKKGTDVEKRWKPRNNPATWQNLMQFMVITGAQAQFRSQHGSDWATNMYDGKPAKGDKNWHKYDNKYALAYDHWHAALNSRGAFYPVDRVDELIDALNKISDRIEKRLAASAAIAANSTRLDSGTVVYQARYTAVDWTGELIASKLNPDGTVGETLWTASIPAADKRNLVTHDGSKAVHFNSTDLLPSDWATQVNVTGATAAEVLAWLRGDQSMEQSFDSNGALTSGKYRKRASLLGDIVNSDPVYVGHQHYVHAGLPEAGSNAYENFVKANKNRVKMLYVGANDGMLHGFVAGAGSGAGHECGTTLGSELFAYIPRSARLKLPTLANPTYGQPGGEGHRYYVDGPPAVGDAYLGGAWKTVLLGTTGAGGRTIFALDVTNPCDFGHGKVLWERDETWDADLGFTLAKPIIARLNNGQWAAVFGNGYNSNSGKAVLFLVDLATGNLIKKFDVGGTDNGLAAPSLYDADGNGTTDFIYAGDLSGRMWKFDVSDKEDKDKWGVAYGGSPLFTAVGPTGQPQPITAAPELGVPPSGGSGVMVYFGTGRFFAVGDEVDLKVQSLYGLLDSGSPIGGRSELVQQTITAEVSVGEKKVRKASTNTVNYPTQRGWYLDLNHGGAKGERVISTPQRKYSRIFYTTLVPSADPCKFGGTSWLMELDPGSGGMPATSVIDLGDEVVAGVMSTVGIVKSFEFLSGEGAVAIGLGSKGTTEAIRQRPPVVSPRTGRISWREIID